MFSTQFSKISGRFAAHFIAFLAATALLLCTSHLPAAAQDPTPAAQSPSPDNGKPKQDAPAEAGGPTDNMGPYAIPKKKAAEDAPAPPPPPKPKKVEDLPDYS